MARTAILLVALAIGLHSVPASAQTEEEKAGARTLFDDAREQMKAHHYAVACRKLEAASKLYGSVGIFLNLGDCYDHLGRTASAWSAFSDAASAATRLGQPEGGAEARRRRAALEPRLARLSVVVPTRTRGLVVERDGVRLDPGAWGTPMPIDPGTHTISAAAPGHVEWDTTVTISEPGRTVTLEVPEPAPEAASADEASTTEPAPEKAEQGRPAPYWTSRRALGAGVAAVGVVLVGVSGALVLSATSEYNSATKETGAARVNDSGSAVTRANAAGVVFGIGVAAAVGGLIVWLTAPNATRSSGSVGLGTDGTDLFVRGTF